MPLTKIHIFSGALVSTVFCAVEKTMKNEPVDPDMLAACFSMGALAGALPDIVEPPLHRRHRSLFHSVAALATAAASLKGVDGIEGMDTDQRIFLKAMILAYISHLLLDSRTRMGIPVFV